MGGAVSLSSGENRTAAAKLFLRQRRASRDEEPRVMRPKRYAKRLGSKRRVHSAIDVHCVAACDYVMYIAYRAS